MGVLNIAYYTILRNLRDWKYLMLLVFAPLLTILITGTATEGKDEMLRTQKIEVAYYNADSGTLAKQFDAFIHGDEVGRAFHVQSSISYDEGYEKAKEGKIEAFIYIPKGFSDSFIKGEKTKVEVYGSKSESWVKPLVESFTSQANAGATALKIGGSPNPGAVLQGVEQIALTSTGKVPNGLDRWTVLNMLIFLFYGALLGSFSILENIKKNTCIRIDCVPIGRFSNTIGIFLGNVATLFICTILVIVSTKYLFGSNWNGNIPLILLAFLLFCMISVSLGIVAAYLTKKSGLCVVIVMCLNVFLFNATVSDAGMGSMFYWLSRVSPHYYAYWAVMNNIFVGSAGRIQTSIASLATMAVLFTGLAVILGRRRPA